MRMLTHGALSSGGGEGELERKHRRFGSLLKIQKLTGTFLCFSNMSACTVLHKGGVEHPARKKAPGPKSLGHRARCVC